MEEKRERIKMWMAVCMGIVALSIDAFQALLTALVIGFALGPVITVAAYFGFWVWFKILGVSFVTNPKKLAWFGLPGLADAFLSALPGLSVSVMATAAMTIAEDKGGIIGKAAEMAQGKIKT